MILACFSNRFTFATKSKFYQPHIKQYFNNKEQNFLQSFKQLQTKANQIGLRQPTVSYSKYLLKEHPKILIAGNQRNKKFEERLTYIKQLETKHQFGPIIAQTIYQNKNLLVHMTESQIQQLLEAMVSFGFNHEQAKAILKTYPKSINQRLIQTIQQKFRIFKDYMTLSHQDCIKLFAKNGFFIQASTKRLTESIVYLRSLSLKSTQNSFITQQQIVNLLFKNGQVFLLGRQSLEDTVKTFRFWGMQQHQYWPILLKNPLLFNNSPYDVMLLKRKLFRYFRFSTEMGRIMMTKYPLALLCSVGSLEAKLVFIKQRLKLPVNKYTLELISFKFSQIRPRGQILVRAKANYTLRNIVDEYIRISDQQFARKLNITLQKYNQEKGRFKETDELDFRRKKLLTNSGIKEKIKSQIKQLRQNF